MISEEELIAWLNDEKKESIQTEVDGVNNYFFKVPRTNQVIFLFHKSSYYGNKVPRHCAFTYVGFYNKSDNSIYDADYCLKRLFPSHVKRIQVGEIYCQINTEVRKTVEEQIGNDKANLTIQALDEANQEKLRQFKKDYLIDEVRKLYLLDIQSDNMKYECWYECEVGEDDLMYQYLACPEKFVHSEAERYIAEHQGDILYGIELALIKKDALQALDKEVDGQLQRIKRIVSAIEKSGAQTVKVTINKNGEEFTFKTSTFELKKDPIGYYTTYNLAVQDCIAFKQKFGQSSHYMPEEIVDISYRGKSIYSAEPYDPEPSETAGMAIGQI